MITQRRQASTSVVTLCVCVFVLLTGTAGAPERNSDGKHDKRKKCCNKTRNKRQFHWSARVWLKGGIEETQQVCVCV